jgi:hypothetical protein
MRTRSSVVTVLGSCLFLFFFACGDDDSGSSGGSAGTSAGGSGNVKPANCQARCEALPANCGSTAAACQQVCVTATDKQLSCFESLGCADQAALQACVGGGSTGGSGGTSASGGTGGTGGTSASGGTGGGAGAGAKAGSGSTADECPNSGGLTSGQCEERTASSNLAVCNNFSVEKKFFACCNGATTDKKCKFVDTNADTGVSIYCCP